MYLIVGCGLSGIVLAERIANELNKKVVIIEKRDHIAGNCYDYIDPDTGILLNKYGAHLFHTNNKKVWDYVNTFCDWIRWDHAVLSFVDEQFVNMPVNINTVNKLCNENIQTEKDMLDWLKENQVVYNKINNSEEMAKSRVGEKLYKKLFHNYTIKQWAKDPKELNKSVLERIPIRSNFDTRYFTDKYQALPKFGYTHFCQKMLNSKNIEYNLNTDFFDFKKKNDLSKFDAIIYTGPIDDYFPDMDKLEYRSIDFKIEKKFNTRYYQPNSVVNYPELKYNFTRIVEYKHFLNQESEHTIIVSETSNDNGDPYYPVPNKRNLDLYEKYKQKAENEEINNIYFLGRLANYKYFNMDAAIQNSLDFFEKKLNIIY